jgi:N-acetylmuramoyl-L-alanine amidase
MALRIPWLQVRILPGPPHSDLGSDATTGGSRVRATQTASDGTRSRVRRLGRRRLGAGLFAPLVVAAAVILLAAGAVGLTFLLQARPHAPFGAVGIKAPLPAISLESADGSGSAAVSTSTAATMSVEVPDLVGKASSVAEALVTAAGLTVQTRVADPARAGAPPDVVTAQWPDAGALVQAGSNVVITYQPRTSTDATSSLGVVVIDAGHQAKADLVLEPIGPGSKTLKAKVAGGATGVATHVPEYERTLEISLALRDALVAQGVRVVMVRTTNNVDIPNSERAAIGNRAKADLVVRVHLDSSIDSKVNGISTLYPSGNRWVGAIEAPSKAAAQLIQASAVRATGAGSRGVFGRRDLTGFNFSTRPTVVVECGFMSNPAEDRRAADPSYEQKIASGIAAGVMGFLQAK